VHPTLPLVVCNATEHDHHWRCPLKHHWFGPTEVRITAISCNEIDEHTLVAFEDNAGPMSRAFSSAVSFPRSGAAWLVPVAVSNPKIEFLNAGRAAFGATWYIDSHVPSFTIA